MSTQVDRETILEAYHDVRNDASETNWAVLKYEGTTIILDSTGEDFTSFSNKFTDDDRAFGFVRIMTGDEMSRRAKFALITWIGENVPPLKKARMSTDKPLVKQVIQSFAVELLISDQSELTEDFIRDELRKAGGADYGTGNRD